MLTVRQIIESKPKPFNIVAPDAKVIEALNRLNEVNLSYLIVLEGAQYRGIFSERDYSRNVVLKGRSSQSATVAEVMTTDIPVVAVTDTVEHAMQEMNNSKTRYLIAYDDDQFVGVITIHDLLRQVINNKENVFDSTLTRNLIDGDERGIY